MSGNMPQRHVQRLMGAFERKDPVSYKVQVLITVVNHFSYGEQFYPKLRTRFLTLVDNPPIPVTIRMNICVGQFCYVRMAQTRKSTEDKGIPVNACPVIGQFDVYDSLQFRSGQIATFQVLQPDIEPCERIGGNSAVFIRRIGHQTQFLDPSADRSGSKTFYRGEVKDEFFDEIPFQLFERNVLDMVFVFEESGKTPASQAVILIGGISAILADTFEETRKVFVEGLQQQAAVIAHTEENVADSFCRDIRIPVAETLVLLADIGLDILQLLIDALGFETSAGGFVCFGFLERSANGEFTAEP